MTTPMRPYMLGMGYGMGSMGNEPGYFGESDPGHSIADVMMRNRAEQGQEEERKSVARWRDAQAEHDRLMDPITAALARAHLASLGAVQGGGGTDGSVDGGLPPPGQGRPQPDGGGGGIGGRGGDRIQFPTGGGAALPAPSAGPGAHNLPGAFNPATNAHNPAGIDLGGGWSLPYGATPAGKAQSSADDLLNSGILPNMTPAMAMYLSQHPEHLAGLINAERARGGAASRWEPQSYDEAVRYYRATHPREERQPGQLTGGQALKFLDDAYGTTPGAPPGQGGNALSPGARIALAQRISRGESPDLPSHHAVPGVNYTPQGPDVSRKHISADQAKYLRQRQGMSDADIGKQYIVDQD